MDGMRSDVRPLYAKRAESVGTRQDEFEQVAMPHTRSLLRVARRLTLDTAVAEDLVQDTLLLAWRGFGQFHAGTNARAWLFRIMFNAFYGHERKVRSAPPIVSLQSSDGDRELQRELPDRTTASALDSVVVADALSQLSVEHRAVLLLGVVEGLTCQEMADALSLPIGTVMSRLSRARQALRSQLIPSCSTTSAEKPGAQWAEKDAS
jgi:RNA polymerase sigma-70 factor, ECF subfamily